MAAAFINITVSPAAVLAASSVPAAAAVARTSSSSVRDYPVPGLLCSTAF